MFSESVGKLVVIDPAQLMPPMSVHWWAAPPKIIGMILAIPGLHQQREAKVHVITDVPGLANRVCWIPVDHLDYLDTVNA